MNERIKELAQQAEGTKKHIPAVWQFYDRELEKFAELIVKECAAVSRKSSKRIDDLSSLIAQDIEKHFGVEE